MSLDKTDEKAVATAVGEHFTRHGLASQLSYAGFLDLQRELVEMIVPQHDIHSAAFLPSDTLEEMALRHVAIAIEEAAKEAQADSTHIAPPSRARRALEMGGVITIIRSLETAVTPEAEKPSRCRAILKDKGYRRLHS